MGNAYHCMPILEPLLSEPQVPPLSRQPRSVMWFVFYAVIKFGLDESTKGSLKFVVYLLGGLTSIFAHYNCTISNSYN